MLYLVNLLCKLRNCAISVFHNLHQLSFKDVLDPNEGLIIPSEHRRANTVETIFI